MDNNKLSKLTCEIEETERLQMELLKECYEARDKMFRTCKKLQRLDNQYRAITGKKFHEMNKAATNGR